MEDFKVYQASGYLTKLVTDASDVRKTEQTGSGDIVSFTADTQTPMKIVVDIDSTGWTGCEVMRTGKNMLDVDSCIIYNTYFLVSEHTALKANTDYIVSINTSGAFWIEDALTLTQIANVNPGTKCTFNTGGYTDIRISIRVRTSGVPATKAEFLTYEPQLEQGSTATDYDEYDGTTINVTFPAEVGTITDGTLTIGYNGFVKLETGGQTYALTSVSPIKTLIGDNNIWADAGPVSVTYLI